MLRNGKKVYLKVKPRLTPSGLGYSDGSSYLSNEEVLIPIGKLQQAIVEDYEATGVGRVEKITIDGNSWIVKAK